MTLTDHLILARVDDHEGHITLNCFRPHLLYDMTGCPSPIFLCLVTRWRKNLDQGYVSIDQRGTSGNAVRKPHLLHNLLAFLEITGTSLVLQIDLGIHTGSTSGTQTKFVFRDSSAQPFFGMHVRCMVDRNCAMMEPLSGFWQTHYGWLAIGPSPSSCWYWYWFMGFMLAWGVAR